MNGKLVLGGILLFPLCLFSQVAPLGASKFSDKRVLIKIPYAEREFVLKGMRKYLRLYEKMFISLSKKNFTQVEELATEMLLDEDQVRRLNRKQNEQFVQMAMAFHSTGVIEVIKAARKKSMEETLVSLSNFTARCNSCHESFRLTEWPEKDYPPAKTLQVVPPDNFRRSEWIKEQK